jgi:probable HAF family extracellular repeat protein
LPGNTGPPNPDAQTDKPQNHWVVERASGIRMLVNLKGIDMTTVAPPSAHQTTRRFLLGLLGTPPSVAVESTAVSPGDAVAQPDTANVYEFTSVDYPGAASSVVYDTDGTTALGAFVFAPGNASSPITAFTAAGGVYQIFNVPDSTASIATAINTSGLIVGAYQDVAGLVHGFATSDSRTFNNVDFPNATNTQANDVNDAGDITGSYIDAGDGEHGFVSSGGSFTAIDFPGAVRTTASGINANGDVVGGYADATETNHGFLLSDGVFTSISFPLAIYTTAFGVNDNGDIAGYYVDAANDSHGFVYADNNFCTVDVAGASATQLTCIKNSGQVTGAYTDALGAGHGLTSHSATSTTN